MVRIALGSISSRLAIWLSGMAMAFSLQASHAASLFGDHSCASWQRLGQTEKRTWANAFLAPLSLTLKGLQKNKVDKYNGDPMANGAAVAQIDAFCLKHPDLGAADGAGLFLKKLYDMPSN
jgi:hypothetical protein